MPGIGADIADPDVTESAYEETPLRPLASLVEDGLAQMVDRYGELTCPLTSLHHILLIPQIESEKR